MWSRISAMALVVAVGLGLNLCAATPQETWPPQVAPVDQSTLKARLDALDGTAGSLPAAVQTAVQFQKTFLTILSGADSTTWRGEIERLANQSSDAPVAAGVREIARAWLARLEMADLDSVLRAYYRKNVCFPATLAEIETDIPEGLRKDPWGGSWVYQSSAPQGFAQLVGQRYQLGPSRFPSLGPLSEAMSHRKSPLPEWNITPQDIAGGKALEFRSARPGAAVATIQPGGKVDDCTLLYIGDHWALMASVDQLFAPSF